jgi:phospholipid/cholesterol/gamma-HCH transport system substrate-binding protein
MQQKFLNLSVGFLVILTVCCLMFIALNASVANELNDRSDFYIYAEFDNISGLRVKSPVKVSGVKVGEVVNISLNKETYQAKVKMQLNKAAKLPIDSEALIFTEGLLGAKYIGIEPGLSEDFLSDGGKIQKTVSAMVLENLIGKFLLKMSEGK